MHARKKGSCFQRIAAYKVSSTIFGAFFMMVDWIDFSFFGGRKSVEVICCREKREICVE